MIEISAFPVDTGLKVNVHQTFNLRSVSTGFRKKAVLYLDNAVISPNSLLWKLCGNCAFPQNFHIRK